MTSPAPPVSLLDRFNRLADGDFSDDAVHGARRKSKLRVTVAGVAFSMLLLELLLARMYPFFLGDISAFVAIPVAMFGLSLGALALHLKPGDASPRWLPVLVPALLVVTTLCFTAFFLLFNHVFNLTHHWWQHPGQDALKTAVFSLVFVPVFALAGVILSIAFTAGARQVGRLYALDLMGSAGACLVTPLALQLMDLPLVICLLLAVLAGCTTYLLSAVRKPILGVLLPLFAAAIPLSATQLIFTEKPDAAALATTYAKNRQVTEVRHRWNAISRVAMVQLTNDKGKNDYRIIHDDGISNVFIRKYRPENLKKPRKSAVTQRIPFLLENTPSTALVMFAGCGKDMILLDEFARGQMSITGVEINPLVVRQVSKPRHDPWNLQTFYNRPTIDLRIAEGRSFLNGDRRTYDLIFLGTNGAQHATRTGHSRKFLDTSEALGSYLDHLNEGGVIVFNTQSFLNKHEIFKRLFEERGYPPLEECLMILGRKPYKPWRVNRGVSVLVKPSGLTPGEVDAVTKMWTSVSKRPVYYAPGYRPHDDLNALVENPIDLELKVPNDNRPYDQMVDFAGFSLTPGADQLKKVRYSLSWIKIFTALLFGTLALLTIVAFYLRGRGGPDVPQRRLPPWLAGYFLLTGVAYMFAQIGLMSKLELFLGNPLYSIAVVLAGYLLSNGAGSAWIGRRQARGLTTPVWKPALASALAVPLLLLLIDGVLLQLLGWPLIVKLVIALVVLFPLGFTLGMFYPIGVAMTVRRCHAQLVPMTFGLATLSSVLGSTWAIVAVINQGFRSVILQAALIYVVLALFAAAAAFVSARNDEPGTHPDAGA